MNCDIPSILLLLLLLVVCSSLVGAAPDSAGLPPEDLSVRVLANPYWDNVVQRAGRTETLCVRLENPVEAQTRCTVRIVLPPELHTSQALTRNVKEWSRRRVFIPVMSRRPVQQEQHLNTTLTWQVTADAEFRGTVKVMVRGVGVKPSDSLLEATFTAPLTLPNAPYVPPPAPAESEYLIGMIYFPGWKLGAHAGWSLIEPYPERKPALGWYNEGNPEVTDWEIKWALEHGIDFFLYCWYRQNVAADKPVDQMLGHAIHDGLFKSRYGDMMKFAIMWTDHGPGGVASEADLINNLLPYWIENYFKRSNYLKVDNKPVLYIYEIEKLIGNLGTPAKVKAAVEDMRAVCVKEGFAGLWVLGEDRGKDPKRIALMKECGLDETFTYCWFFIPPDSPPEQAIALQMSQMEARRKWAILPSVPTLSMGWNATPWETYLGYGKGWSWRLPAKDFRALCERVKQMMPLMPKGSLASKMILLDNWNEYGEGHYMAPTRIEGFGYMDAVREVFTDALGNHADIVPGDVGLGPYDQDYVKWRDAQEASTESQPR